MREQDFNLSVSKQLQQVLAELVTVRAELDTLKQKAAPLPRANTTSNPPPSTSTLTGTRRKTLKRLGLALLGGAAAATASGFSVTEAKMVVSPASGNGQVGTLIAPPGKDVPTGFPDSGKYMGLVSTDGVALNLSLLPVQIRSGSAGVLGYSGNALGVGVVGLTSSNNTIGVYGFTTDVNSYGVYGRANNTNSVGVYGFAGETGSYGVYGIANKAFSYAGYFTGDVMVTGTINKSAVGFKIDHPLDPAGKYLYHTSVESPDMMNIYNGLINLDGQGEAVVEMPEWFEALNSDFRYQLTSIGVSMPNLFIAEKLTGRKFKIAGGKPGQEISWQVTGIRQDAYARAHRIPVEQEKSENEKGKYIHPELFGQSEEMSVSLRPKV